MVSYNMSNFDLNSFFSNDLLKTNKGGAKESIYKKDIFEGVDNKKSLRTKLRKLMFNYCSSIINITDNEKAKNLAKDFSNFYASVYKVNDFSLSSVSSANTEESKKEILTKGLEKFNTLLNEKKGSTVLILVVMEDGLVPRRPISDWRLARMCLNPCCDGRGLVPIRNINTTEMTN